MSDQPGRPQGSERPYGRPGDDVTVRLWAGAQAAAGRHEVQIGPAGTVGEAVAALVAAYPALLPITEVATLLVDGTRVTAADGLTSDAVLEVLPPFAGG